MVIFTPETSLKFFLIKIEKLCVGCIGATLRFNSHLPSLHLGGLKLLITSYPQDITSEEEVVGEAEELREKANEDKTFMKLLLKMMISWLYDELKTETYTLVLFVFLSV